MKNKSGKIAFILVLVMVINYCLPMINVFADDTNSNYVKSTYNFTSNEDNNVQLEDTFEYSDYLFKKSSFENNLYLELLSAQISEASASWYGDSEDKYELDPSLNAHNVVNMLTKMNFDDVSTNKYYTLEKEENSIGVAVGHKQIKTTDDNYTLIAIIPRSAGYKQEWAGNFTVGDGDIHQGFKAARDEVLRYVKEYINNNGIKGKIKVWTAGHSRGAAVANMVGAFFAGGGIEYFDDIVEITPEDVYCYTFATPRTIKNGASKNLELSVSGNREDIQYKNDTKGEYFKYTKGGKVNPNDDFYRGIRNIISSDDIITMLPPETWGFTHYGTDLSIDYNDVKEEDMLNELSSISLYTYNKYINGGSPNVFERKNFDLKTLSIVKDNGNYSAMSIDSFLEERLNGLVYNAMTNKKYVDDGYQDILKSIAGIYGMSMVLFDDDTMSDTSSIISPLLLSYLAYANERLREEGIASNENEALFFVLKDFIKQYTGAEINVDTSSIDDLVVILAKFIHDNEDEAISDEIINLIVSIVPEEYRNLLSVFNSFAQTSYDDEVTKEEGLKAFLIACYAGASEDSIMYEDYKEPEKVRMALYGIAVLALSNSAPEIVPLFMDSNYNMNGAGKVIDLIDSLLSISKIIKDENNNIIETCSSIDELADYELTLVLDSIFDKMIDNSEELYGDKYKEAFANHFNTLKSNITDARRIIMYALFYEEGNYNLSDNIGNLMTLVGNIDMIPLAHYNEIYLAYSKARTNGLEFPLEPVVNIQEENNAKIESPIEDVIDNIELTEEERQAINNGKNINVYLEVKDIKDNISEDDKNKIEDAIGDNETVALYLDISLFKEIEGSDVTRVTKLDKPIKISFEIPEEYINKNSSIKRIYKVYRLHAGVIDELDVTVNDLTATFETDEFSTYVLTYDDVKLEESNPKTADNINIYIMLLLLSSFGIIKINRIREN